MVFHYWTFSLRPKPASLDRYGAGVFVVNQVPDEARTFITSREHDHASTCGAALRHIETLFQRLECLLHETPSPFSGEAPNVFQTMKTLSGDWANMIVVEGPKTVVAETIDDALNILVCLCFPTAGNMFDDRKHNEIRGTVANAYVGQHMIRPLLREDPTLSTRWSSPKQLDFAVANSLETFELVGVFDFAGSENPSALQNRVEAWTWRVGQIRGNGGTLAHDGIENIVVDNDTPVVAVIRPPETDEQTTLYRNATAGWGEFSVKPIPYTHVVGHTKTLGARLVAQKSR